MDAEQLLESLREFCRDDTAFEQLQNILSTVGKNNPLLEIHPLHPTSHSTKEDYRNIFEDAVEGIFQTTLSGSYIRANSALAKILGYASPAELISTIAHTSQLYVNVNRQNEFVQLIQANGSVSNFESQVYRKDGSVIWVAESARLVQGANSQPSYYEGFVRDITERKQEENALRENQRVLSTLMSNLPGVAYRCFHDRLRTIESISEGCFTLTGYQPSDLLNNSKIAYGQLIHPDDRELVWNKVQTATQIQQPFWSIYRITKASGEERWVWERGRGIFSNEGQLLAVEGFITDITERRQADEALRKAHQQLKFHIENSPLAVMEWDNEMRLQYWSPQAEKLFGWQAEELLGKHFHDCHCVYDEDAEAVNQLLERLLKGDEIRNTYQNRNYTIDGSVVQCEWYNSALLDESGKLVSLLSQALDITERKQAEMQLQQQAKRDRLLGDISLRIHRSLNLEDILNTVVTEVRQFLRSDRVVVYRFESQGKVLAIAESVSSNWLSLAGRIVEDSWLRDGFTMGMWADVLAVQDIWQSHLSPEKVNLLARHQVQAFLAMPILQGEQLWGVLTAHQCSTPRDWQPFEIDLLQRLATQVAIAIQQSELYQQVQQLNSDLERQVQERTIELQQSLQFEAVLKRITDKVRDSLDENHILQTAVRELASALKVASCDTGLYNSGQATSTIRYEYATSTSTSQGLMLRMADFPEFYGQLLQGNYFQFCDPQAIRGRVAMLACPIFDDKGVLGDLCLSRQPDYYFNELEIRLVQQVANQCAIALRQARLYQAAQTQVQELEKLNRLKDEFLSTVSHELRTPVSNMKMAIHMLKTAPNAARQERYLKILQDECNRESDLINDLLDLQRLEAHAYPVSRSPINLKDWLGAIIEPFQSRTQTQQQIFQIDVPSNLPTIVSDASALGRILAELLNNACKYTPAGGQITLNVCHQSSFSALTFESTPITTFVVANQADIPGEEIARVFDKFYRVPNADPWKRGGTGLGLALVQKFVEQLEGTIQLKSSEGWTKFTVQVPTQAWG